MYVTFHRKLCFTLGAENYILVNCQDVKEYLSCKIQDLNSDVNIKPLPIVNLGENMLLCGPFVPNDNPFYVQVNNVLFNYSRTQTKLLYLRFEW